MRAIDQYLFQAVKENNLEEVEKSLQQGANINERNEDNETVLMLAAKAGHLSLVEQLLLNKADINLDTQEPNFEMALSFAAEINNQAIVQLLFTQPKLSQANLNRALIYFAEIGDIANVKEALKKGADINARYIDETALINAVTYGQVELAKELLNNPQLKVNECNYRHESPLIIALLLKDKQDEMIDALLTRKDIDLHIQGYLTGTALTYAIFLNNKKIAKLLLQQEEKIALHDHPCALSLSISRDWQDIVEEFLRKGANPNSYPYEGAITVPDWVWKNEYKEFAYPVNLFEEADLPLIQAIKKQSLVLVNLLLKWKANPYKKDKQGQDAFMTAKQGQSLDIQEELQKSLHNSLIPISGIFEKKEQSPDRTKTPPISRPFSLP